MKTSNFDFWPQMYVCPHTNIDSQTYACMHEDTYIQSEDVCKNECGIWVLEVFKTRIIIEWIRQLKKLE